MGRVKKGPFTKADEFAVIERRVKVAKLYLRGTTQYDIAGEIGVDRSTIARDLEAVRKEWMASSLVDFNEAKAVELQKLDHLESVAWQGWERSCLDAVTVQHKTEKVRKRKSKEEQQEEAKGKRRVEEGEEALIPIKVNEDRKVSGQAGDPRFLEQVYKCIDARLKVLGAYKDQTVNNYNQVIVKWEELYGRDQKGHGDKIEERIAAAALPAHEED